MGCGGVWGKEGEEGGFEVVRVKGFAGVFGEVLLSGVSLLDSLIKVGLIKRGVLRGQVCF